MDKINEDIPSEKDDMFFTSAGKKLSDCMLRHLFSLGIKSAVESLPDDWLASLQAKYASQTSESSAALMADTWATIDILSEHSRGSG